MNIARVPRPRPVAAVLAPFIAACLHLAAATAGAQPRQPDVHDFAARFHAEDTTVLVVEDPLPHLRLLLTSEPLRRAMRVGAIGRLVGDEADRVVDPVEGWDWLSRNLRWVPDQVAVGMSDAGFADVDHLLRAVALVELLEGADVGDADDAKVRDERRKLRQAAAAELPQVRVPRFRLYARFRTPEDAVALLELLKDQSRDVDPADLPDAVRIEHHDASVAVRVAVGDLIGDDAAVADALTRLHVVDAEADGEPAVRQAVAAVRALTAEASVERFGRGLLLTVGPRSAGGPPGLPAGFVDLPAAVGRPDPSTLFWARWNVGRLKQAAAGWAGLREQWVESVAHRLLPSTEDYSGESMLDGMQLLAVQLDRLSATGSARAWADAAAPAVRFAASEHDVPEAADLARHPLAALLPADAEAYQADTTTSLADLVSDQLLQVEDRLAVRSLRAEVDPNDPAAGVAKRVEAGYYAHFARLRELAHRTARERFGPGSAVVFGTKGRLERVEVSFEADNRPQRFGGRDLPIPELALVGRPKAPADEASVRRFVEELYAALATGIRSAARPANVADRPVPAVDRIASTRVDLGLGVATWEFGAAALTAASGEAKVRVDVVGDLRPHFFVVDGTLVLSTSPRLSRTLLAARGGAAPRLALPPADGASLVSVGRYPGEPMARGAEHVKAWVVAAADDAGRAAGRPADAAETEEAGRMLDAAAQFTRLIDRAEWQTVRPAGVSTHVTHGTVFFEAAK